MVLEFSRQTVQLMTTNHIGDLPMGFGQLVLDLVSILALFSIQARLERLALLENIIGGCCWNAILDRPKEKMIGLFMVQSIPHRTRLAGDFKVLAYQAMTESYAD